MTFKHPIRDEVLIKPIHAIHKPNGELYDPKEVEEAIRLANRILDLLTSGSTECEKMLHPDGNPRPIK